MNLGTANVRPIILLPNETFNELVCEPHIFAVFKVDKPASAGYYYEVENCQHCGKTVYECYEFKKQARWGCLSVGMVGNQPFACNSGLRLISNEEYDHLNGVTEFTPHQLVSNTIVKQINTMYGKKGFVLKIEYDEKVNIRKYTVHAVNAEAGPFIIGTEGIQALNKFFSADTPDAFIEYLHNHDVHDLLKLFMSQYVQYENMNYHAMLDGWT